MVLALAFGQLVEPAEPAAISEERVEDVREAFRARALIAANENHTGSIAHGAFANDPQRCIEIFSERFERVWIENYVVETRYSGASVAYIFHSVSLTDEFFDQAERTAPASQPFLCQRIADWGDLLAVEPME